MKALILTIATLLSFGSFAQGERELSSWEKDVILASDLYEGKLAKDQLTEGEFSRVLGEIIDLNRPEVVKIIALIPQRAAELEAQKTRTVQEQKLFNSYLQMIREYISMGGRFDVLTDSKETTQPFFSLKSPLAKIMYSHITRCSSEVIRLLFNNPNEDHLKPYYNYFSSRGLASLNKFELLDEFYREADRNGENGDTCKEVSNLKLDAKLDIVNGAGSRDGTEKASLTVDVSNGVTPGSNVSKN